MPTQKWKVVVAKLGASSSLHEGEVDAANWMSALRAARQSMSERPSLPPGASCTVDSQGVATILDPSSRRKFVLAPIAAGASGGAVQSTAAAQPAPAQPAPVQQAAPMPKAAAAPSPRAPSPVRPEPIQAAPAAPPVPVVEQKKVRFQTVARIADAPVVPTEKQATPHSAVMQSTPRSEQDQGEPTPRAPAPPTAPAAVAAPNKKRFNTVAFVDGSGPGVQREISVAGESADKASPNAAHAEPKLEPLLERDEEPSESNPLHYKERAFLLPRGMSVSEAEAALRWKLAELQEAMSSLPRGKLVNLAVFDHRWQDTPDRPPVIVLQWRDWRNEVTVDYPAAARLSSPPPPPPQPEEDLLADVFEALEGLSRLHTAAEGLGFCAKLLGRMIPSEAVAGCLYDINTDELRFVALAGTGADAMQGKAVPRAQGLFGPALRSEHSATVFNDLRLEAAFVPGSDGRVGLNPRNALLGPVVHDHQLLGMLQLINRAQLPAFTAQDVSVINYVAERLADFLYAARQRQRARS